MRLYKIQIIGRPAESLDRVELEEDGTRTGYGLPGWKPAGWDVHVENMGWEPGTEFFWPSTGPFFSRSTARDKQRIVQRWGGEAIILEAEVLNFIPVTEANALRKRRRDSVRIAKLQAQIDAIAGQS